MQCNDWIPGAHYTLEFILCI